MKNPKSILRTLIIGALIVAGIGVGFLVYKNIADQPATVVTQTEEVDAFKAIEQVQSSGAKKKGNFTDIDAVHKGSGTASVIQTDDGPALVLSDFNVTRGPDLFVYLSPNSDGEPLGAFASLGRLKSNSGEQVYNLPDDYDSYESVVVWCRAFGVKFTYANLE